MQHKTRSSDETHLSQREGGSPEQPQQWSEEQQGWCEVLAEPFVIHRRQLSGMLHVGGELRGEGALEPMAMQAVPKHLLKNALVVAGQQDPGTPGLQAQADHGEQTSSNEDATGRQQRHLHASFKAAQRCSDFITFMCCGAPGLLSKSSNRLSAEKLGDQGLKRCMLTKPAQPGRRGSPLTRWMATTPGRGGRPGA